ncbi:MAG: F0F1 ATP synthase subunit A [Parabacteroides sp.]|nr:F0F1 ATP synthase subunit A [Parabacteroides sp.]
MTGLLKLKLKWKWIGLLLLLLCTGPAFAATGEQPAVDVQEIVFSHIQDAYTWHITEWNGKEISIPLPIIVRSREQGWAVFSSAHLHEGKSYLTYSIAQEGPYQGKVVERSQSGEEIRPLDLSLTKNVCAILISCGLLVFIVLRTANWYARHAGEVPDGFTGMMEAAIMYIQEEVIKTSIGETHYRSYSSFLLTAFFFILLNNLIGIIPVFPGGANVTGNITVTAVLAGCTFIAINLFAGKAYWKDIFWPDTPVYLKLPVPIMPFAEFLGIFTKPIALMIRLFANIMAGHSIILALTCLIFITASMGIAINAGMTVLSVFFCTFMNGMEILVAFLQAYIFTMLSANFIGQSKATHK